MIRSTAAVILLLLFGFVGRAKAQEIETRKVELYGGYDYDRYNVNPRINGVPPSESFGANSITSQAAYNAYSRFGIVGELSAYSLARRGFNTTHQVSYLIGPRVSHARTVALCRSIRRVSGSFTNRHANCRNFYVQ
jgi:hypothetical protein